MNQTTEINLTDYESQLVVGRPCGWLCISVAKELNQGLAEKKKQQLVVIAGLELGIARFRVQWPVSRKSRKLSGPEKPFVKLRPANYVKPVFSYVVKGIKIKINARFRASRRFRFEDTK